MTVAPVVGWSAGFEVGIFVADGGVPGGGGEVVAVVGNGVAGRRSRRVGGHCWWRGRG